MNKNPEALMMIGLPGSGKSTYINSLLSNNPDKEYVILSTDNIIEAWGKELGLNYNQAFIKFGVKDAEAKFKAQAKQAINDKKNVIFDRTNLSMKSRNRLLSWLSDDYRKVAVVFQIDDKVLNDRRSKRYDETGKSVPQKVLDDMEKSFVYPTNDEFDEIIVIKG